MSYVDFITPALEHAKIGAAADEAKNYDEAYKAYMKSIEFFMTAIKYEKKNPKKSDMLRGKVMEIMDRAEQIKEHLNKKVEATATNPNDPVQNKPKKGENGKSGGNGGGKEDDEDKKKFENALSSAIVREKPNVKWDDVAGLDQAKEALKEAVILPMKFPQLFTGKRTPWRGILLYGPPGTGKSYLAKAVATEADATFFSISSSDLVSKWQGESERLVKTLFEMAREHKPSIIFIDEVDSLCGARGDGENESSRRIKNEFLVNMQGVGHDTTGVLVLAATNLPWAIDPAIRRRLERRIYIPLPEEAPRREMFKINIGQTPHSLTGKDFDYLAKKTDGYSGSDISILVRNALMEPIRTLQVATHFKRMSAPDPKDPGRIVNDWMTPCSPGDPSAVETTLMKIPPEKLLPPNVSMDDFLKALKTIKPSVSFDDLGDFEKFTSEFGSEG